MQNQLTPVHSPYRADTGSAAHRAMPELVQRPRTIASRSLLDGANEIQIEHFGAIYRLRLTALGKLILTK